jgi:hypothetical protein
MTDRFLPTALRRALEKTVKAAREVAEEGAADAVRRLGVADASPPAHLSEDAKALRRRLRAHARTLGDMVIAEGVHEVRHLVEATGYAQWHRRLFARFLAERGLLRHPEHGPVTLEDCEELAKLEHLADAWAAAETYGAKMLPGVFLPDDPVLALELAPEHAQALRQLVDSLDAAIFQADDSLGWTYQFWRAAEKDRVNKAGEKIGARDLPAVTQLFTEPYMVKFLLHNTLGAWRAGKVLAKQPGLATGAADEETLRLAVSPPGYVFDMLRFVREGEDAPRWRPAAGTFSGWPEAAAAIRALDPCCGSGHFLTEMLAILSALRMDEEGLADAAAVAAVLRDNLFGLELDGRCVQIAAFAVALTAWRVGGFQPFGPEQVHIAWVGAPPPLDRSEFLALANGDDELRKGLAGLHDLFAQAPLLGSLIDPTGGDLMSSQRLGRIEPLLDRLVEKTRAAEPERAEGAVAARGMADAAAILSRRYTLVATNVPFLGRNKQNSHLATYIDQTDKDAKTDLATAILSRSLRLLAKCGSMAAVTPQNWLFLGSYRSLRARVLDRTTINIVAALGPRAFETISGEIVNTALVSLTSHTPNPAAEFSAIDANEGRNADQKRVQLLGDLALVDQAAQMKNPDTRISFVVNESGSTLGDFAYSFQGLSTGDNPRFRAKFWEIKDLGSTWECEQSTVDAANGCFGRTGVIRWEGGRGELYRFGRENVASLHNVDRRGEEAWGKNGVAVTQMGDLPATLYGGHKFDTNTAVIVPTLQLHLPAIWAFCSSTDYRALVRQIDQSIKVTNASLVKIPFDLAHWTSLAAERYPNGLPEPYSNDPSQWLFHGHPTQAEIGTQLHVVLARLAGYRWPTESDPDMRLSAEARSWIEKLALLPPADNDGLLSLEAVAGEQTLSQRLRSYLADAFPETWSDELERRLVAEADQALDKKVARDGSLEAWLRDRAFRQHCRLFHDRPFLWQVWDGSPDGFLAFVHYHRLDAATLGKLTYTVLGDWIARMSNAGDARRVEAAKILQQKLTAILGGEDPFDIFVRWKPLERQPIGWDPDLDDGVRLNIRPFVEAGVLRETPKIKWGVDRGSDAASAPWFPHDKGKRNNDRHLTLAEKQAARGAK